VIRVARHEDTDAVLALWGQARSAAATTPDDAESVARVLEQGALLVAESAGEVVGALIAGWDGWRGSMYRLAVLPAHRRRGIATRLVEAGHERLRALGARRVTALVGADEEDATGFWASAGYAHDREIARFVRNLTGP
jgi:ribosomal protein S18 acetylase RimI-like enzyme